MLEVGCARRFRSPDAARHALHHPILHDRPVAAPRRWNKPLTPRPRTSSAHTSKRCVQPVSPRTNRGSARDNHGAYRPNPEWKPRFHLCGWRPYAARHCHRSGLHLPKLKPGAFLAATISSRISGGMPPISSRRWCFHSWCISPRRSAPSSGRLIIAVHHAKAAGGRHFQFHDAKSLYTRRSSCAYSSAAPVERRSQRCRQIASSIHRK